MAMLAEPRRKQKVINLRAKNTAWSNDTNKFGQRMLEKMGWSAGKGLGAKENGIVEHIVARYKNDERGLGFEDKNDQWTKHEDDFNALLANLSNGGDNKESLHSGISLEVKSKKSKARIHYHKFTRGKDISRYSEKDLANIFGKRSFKETAEAETLKEDVKSSFTEKGNMDDYFKNKMAAIKSKTQLFDVENKVIKEEDMSDFAFQGFANTKDNQSDNEDKCYPSFSFYESKNKILSTNELPQSDEVKETSKKKKKKKLQSKDIKEESSPSELLQSGENLEIKEVLTKKKSKKEKKETQMEEEMQEYSKSKKKKKNKHEQHNYVQEEKIESYDDYVPKKKKKRKQNDN